jgi:hypothetical protein
MVAGCWQRIWAVGRTMWARSLGYCQLIWAENRDVCRLRRRCLQVATATHNRGAGIRQAGRDPRLWKLLSAPAPGAYRPQPQDRRAGGPCRKAHTPLQTGQGDARAGDGRRLRSAHAGGRQPLAQDARCGGGTASSGCKACSRHRSRERGGSAGTTAAATRANTSARGGSDAARNGFPVRRL